MTPEQIALIRSSWSKVLPIADTAARLFYERLFEVDPAARSLFTGNMEEQGANLMRMLNKVVRGLDRPEATTPLMEELGRRHAEYGVMDEHYDAVGEALLGALEQGLGEDFTPQVREAWASAYKLIASTMKDAAAAT